MSSMMEMPWVLVAILVIAALAVALPLVVFRWLASRQLRDEAPETDLHLHQK